MKDYPNEEALRKAHRIYLDAMREFIYRCLKRVQGTTAKELIITALDCEPSDDIEIKIEVNNIPHLIREYWNDCFYQEFDHHYDVRSATGRIKDGRNFWAHPGIEDVDPEDTRMHLSLVAEALGKINKSNEQKSVKIIRDRLFSDEVEEHPAEVENAALKKELLDISDKLAVVEGKNKRFEKRLQDAQNRLEELEGIEAEWMDSDKRLASVSNELKAAKEEQVASEENRKAIVSKFETVETERTKLIGDLNTTSTWLEDAEKEKADLETRLKKSEKEKNKLKEDLKSRSDQLEKLRKVEKKEQADSFKSIPIRPKTTSANDVIDPKPLRPEVTVTGGWTIDRVRDSLSDEVRKSHEANFSEDRRNIFYRRVAETQNLVETEGWRINSPKLNMWNCAFFLMDKSVTRIRRAFGILLHTYLSERPVDRNGKRIPDLSIRSNPPRIFVAITKEEAEQLECEHGCDFFAVDRYLIYYNVSLKKVLEVKRHW